MLPVLRAHVTAHSSRMGWKWVCGRQGVVIHCKERPRRSQVCSRAPLLVTWRDGGFTDWM